MNIIDEVKLDDGLHPLILSNPNQNSYLANAAKMIKCIDE